MQQKNPFDYAPFAHPFEILKHTLENSLSWVPELHANRARNNTYFTKSKRSCFWSAPPPYPWDRTTSNNSPPRVWKAGLVPGVARRNGNRSNWTMYYDTVYFTYTRTKFDGLRVQNFLPLALKQSPAYSVHIVTSSDSTFFLTHTLAITFLIRCSLIRFDLTVS